MKDMTNLPEILSDVKNLESILNMVGSLGNSILPWVKIALASMGNVSSDIFKYLFSKQIAHKEAEADLIKKGYKTILEELKDEGFSIREIKEFMNLFTEFSKAYTLQKENHSTIDYDWMCFFSDHAKKTSEERIQDIWANILTGEINKKGSYSKNTMSILSRMTKEDAEDFTQVVRNNIDNGFILNPLYSNAIPIEYFNRSLNLGLISPIMTDLKFEYIKDKDNEMLIGNKTYNLDVSTSNSLSNVVINGFTLSISGKELMQLIDKKLKPTNNFLEIIRQELKIRYEIKLIID